MISAAVLRNPEKRRGHLERIGSVYRDRRDGEVAVDILCGEAVPNSMRVFSGISYATYKIHPSDPTDLTPTDVLLDLLHEYDMGGNYIDPKRIRWFASLLSVADGWDGRLEGWDAR